MPNYKEQSRTTRRTRNKAKESLDQHQVDLYHMRGSSGVDQNPIPRGGSVAGYDQRWPDVDNGLS